MVWRPIGEVKDPFEREGRYRVIYADPPWIYRDRAQAGRRGVAYKYPLLNDEDIAALPVQRIAADDSMLFLWVTWPKLQEVLPVVDAWGFRFRTVAFVWVKRTRVSGALAWGMGSWTRANTEPCLLATRGRPKRFGAGVHQVVEAPLARHSEKPREVRERIVQLAGDVSRIELFARQLVPGWDAWGNDLQTLPIGVSNDSATAGLPPRGSREWCTLREQILEHVRANGPASRRELSAALGVSPDVAKALLASLVREAVLVKRGRTRGTRYELVDTGEHRRDGAAEASPAQLPLRPRDS
jgi:N6-adenosine-specific RNA methylase IME4